MKNLILAFSVITIGIALAEYVLYNLIVLLMGVMRSSKTSADFTPQMTVIIPAHNEERHIQRKIENVLDSDYPPESLEILVIDDGSTDRTAEIVRGFEAQGVRLFQTGERKGKIFAQKLAFAEATSEFLVITDATVVVPSDGLRKLAAHMADPGVGAVSGRISVRNRDTNYITRVSQFLFDIQNAQKLGESRLDSAAGLFGQLSIIRRDAVGDFSTEVVYEDREFGIRLRERGYRAKIEPDVTVSYYAAETFADFVKQKHRNIGAMTQSLVRHWKLLFNPKFGWYGMLIFPEYSLFRLARPYLLALSFLSACAYCLFFDLSAATALFSSMAVAVFGSYIIGTVFLAPLVARPARFVGEIFTMLPAMAIVAVHLAIGSMRYFRGAVDPKWDRIERDRYV
jgi:cellulose synthase/poly-beta-1,6-N-acetylglucosamine synthase-like glycosyltransferase